MKSAITSIDSGFPLVSEKVPQQEAEDLRVAQDVVDVPSILYDDRRGLRPGVRRCCRQRGPPQEISSTPVNRKKRPMFMTFDLGGERCTFHRERESEHHSDGCPKSP